MHQSLYNLISFLFTSSLVLQLEVKVRLGITPLTSDSDFAFGVSAPIAAGESTSAFGGGTAPFWATVLHEQVTCLIGMDDSVTLTATPNTARRMSATLCGSSSAVQLVEQLWYIGAGLDTQLELRSVY